ncbi:MAG: polyprenyl synthetase family protein [Rhodobacterales bacterium]
MFRSRLDQVASQVQAHLDLVMAPLDGPVAPAMRYTCQGGKRLRAFLVLESARLHDVDLAHAIWPAAAIEMIHAYSLVHDDLPCMDDDDLRRGRPTVHVKWDEGTAVLTGDALQTLAFECLARPECHPDAAVRADLVLTMAQAAGAQGMVLGQALDIAAETSRTPLRLDEIITLQDGKTGALIRWSAMAGPLMARDDPAPLRHYAQALGLAFQIADDILDVTGDEDAAGKRLHKDAEAGKATFVSHLGLEGAKARASDLVIEAIGALEPYGPDAENLRDAARFVISRDS